MTNKKQENLVEILHPFLSGKSKQLIPALSNDYCSTCVCHMCAKVSNVLNQHSSPYRCVTSAHVPLLNTYVGVLPCHINTTVVVKMIRGADCSWESSQT